MVNNRTQKHFTRTVGRDMKAIKEDNKKIGGLKAYNKLSNGELTRRLLKRRKVESPDTQTRVKIAPGFWVIPKAELKTVAETAMFIEEMRMKYQLDQYGKR